MRPRLIILSSLTLLIFFPWFVSGGWWYQFPIRRGKSLYCIDLSVGRIWLVHYTVNTTGRTRRDGYASAFIADVGPPGWRLLPTFQHDRPGTPLAFYNNTLTFHWHIGLPLYPLFLATGIPAAFMWRTWFRQRRQAREGHCPNCGYDLAGPQGPCPECGAAHK